MLQFSFLGDVFVFSIMQDYIFCLNMYKVRSYFRFNVIVDLIINLEGNRVVLVYLQWLIWGFMFCKFLDIDVLKCEKY